MKKDLRKILDKIDDTPGILGSRNYFQSVVLIPFLQIDDKLHLLFEKRANHIRQGGEVSFPGGGIDSKQDRSFQQTAIRETCEELGIRSSDIRIYKQFDTIVVPHGNMVFTFLGEIKSDAFVELKLNKQEVEYVFTVPFSYFRENPPQIYSLRSQMYPYKIDENGRQKIIFPASKLGVPEKYGKPWGNKEHPVYAYKINEEIIWGLTAQIIFELVRKLN